MVGKIKLQVEINSGLAGLKGMVATCIHNRLCFSSHPQCFTQSKHMCAETCLNSVLTQIAMLWVTNLICVTWCVVLKPYPVVCVVPQSPAWSRKLGPRTRTRSSLVDALVDQVILIRSAASLHHSSYKNYTVLRLTEHVTDCAFIILLQS